MELPILNKQPPEKRVDQITSVVEIVGKPWLTIQGEGPFAGRVAVFIRLAGCNLQCPSCDTDYTTDRQRVNVRTLVNQVHKMFESMEDVPHKELVVITGGEPFRQNISRLVGDLIESSFTVQIETNGTLPPPPGFDWVENQHENLHVVCSPKAPVINAELLPYITAYKYILDVDHIDIEDGLPNSVLENGLRPARPDGTHIPVYVQPAQLGDGRDEVHIKAAVDSCLNYGYILSLQIHKIIGLK